MNNISKIPTFKRYSHSLKIVFNVFYWVAIIAAVLSLATAIVINFISNSHFILSESSIGHLSITLNGFIGYRLHDMTNDINTKNIYTIILISSTVIFAFVIPICKQLVLILKSIEIDKPFATENAKRIATIGVILILSSIVFPIFEVMVAQTMVDTLHIDNIDINYSVNFILILSGILMFILSGIFSYGSYLQNEFDETV